MRQRLFALLFLVATPSVLLAQSCERPHPFDRTAAIRGHVTFSAGSGSTCDIVASLDANNSTPSGAFAWYSLPTPETTWRISFRIDTSGLIFSLLDTVTLLSVTSRYPYPASDGDASLLRVGLLGDPAVPVIELSGSCAGSSAVCVQGRYYAINPSPIADGDVLRFELDVGPADAGRVSFWQNANFTDPPTFVASGLDNANWLGAQRVAFGAFAPTSHIASSGGTLRFANIETLDDILFWSDFDD